LGLRVHAALLLDGVHHCPLDDSVIPGGGHRCTNPQPFAGAS
jgi:hypothetical protein